MNENKDLQLPLEAQTARSIKAIRSPGRLGAAEHGGDYFHRILVHHTREQRQLTPTTCNPQKPDPAAATAAVCWRVDDFLLSQSSQ